MCTYEDTSAHQLNDTIQSFKSVKLRPEGKAREASLREKQSPPCRPEVLLHNSLKEPSVSQGRAGTHRDHTGFTDRPRSASLLEFKTFTALRKVYFAVESLYFEEPRRLGEHFPFLLPIPVGSTRGPGASLMRTSYPTIQSIQLLLTTTMSGSFISISNLRI